jgi:Cu-Zn family superoxide dismutase
MPPMDARHAGDLGNLTADADGKAHYEITVTNISVSSAGNSVLGRAVIVHAKPDDGGQPTGNAGARVGCGVISSR